MKHGSWRDMLIGSGRYFVSAVAAAGSAFVISLIVSRELGREGLGILSAGLTVIMIGALVSDLGLNSHIIREFSTGLRSRAGTLGTIIVLRACWGSVVGIALYAFARLFFPSGMLESILLPSALLVLARSVCGVLESYVKALRLSRVYLAVALSAAVVQIGVAYAAVQTGYGVPGVLFGVAAVEGAKVAALAWTCRSFISLGPVPGLLASLRPVIVAGLPFALMALFSTLSDRADLLVLTAMRGVRESGLYAAADRFLALGNLADFALLGAALPAFAAAKNQADMSGLTRGVFRVIIPVTLVATLGIWLLSPYLMGLTFRFEQSVSLLRILILALPAMFINSVLRVRLFAARRERLALGIYTAASVLNLALNALFIPRFGAAGTCVIAVITEYCVMAMSFAVCSRALGSRTEPAFSVYLETAQ